MLEFSELIISWWNENGRAFPWRSERDPYKLLLAEVLLHRTRAETVVPVYNDLIIRFENISELASADPTTLGSIIGSLGLRWRIKLIIDMARIISTKFAGTVPLNRTDLLDLPGIGDYIASAIRVFCIEESDPLIDTNTVRIISRINGIHVTDSTRRGKKIRGKYADLLGIANSKKFGYAMIDLAASICLVKKPKCSKCPVTSYCNYYDSIRLEPHTT